MDCIILPKADFIQITSDLTSSNTQDTVSCQKNLSFDVWNI